MNIFLSHASEQAEIAERIEVALRSEGHAVFLSRTSLPAGESYNDQIREAISGCDLFVFLVSPEAVARGRYTITELEFARQRWSNPSNQILPVVVSPTDLTSIPAYLRAVTLLEPKGNVPAAVAAAVARMAWPRWRRLLRRWAALLVVAGLVGAGFVAWWGLRQRATARETSDLLEAGRLQHESRQYSATWDLYARAAALSSRDQDIVAARERLAMDWLENIRVTVGKNTFTGVVEQVEPVLLSCSISQDARRAADCLAHLGWADFLRSREGTGVVDPVDRYRRALALDPENVYAHSMWGFELLRTRGSMGEAKAHFDRALATRRERAYVRHLELAGFFWGRDPESEDEALRVVNDMRLGGESLPAESNAGSQVASRLWIIYSDRALNRTDRRPSESAPSAADQLATFRWLFPETKIPADRRHTGLFVVATLQEQAGQRADALSTFRTLHDALAREGALAMGGPLPERTVAAVRRLAK